jgi:hypothetical protein
MLPTAIVSILLGAVLAQRFKFWILLPLFVLAILVSISAAFARHDGALAAEFSAMVIIGLQIGYVAGLGLGHIMLLSRVSSRPRRAALSRLFPRRLI